jgi:uncharacterized protein YkwD
MERRCPARALLLVVAVVALAAPAFASAGRAARQPALVAQLVREMNALREQEGLRPLRVNGPLVDAARSHSLEMASVGYFAHHSADGGSFAARVRHWYVVRRHWAAGENLAWSTPKLGSSRLVQLWLASPEHRANMLDPGWRDVGCSAVHAESAPGVYDGEPVTVVTCDFGARS